MAPAGRVVAPQPSARPLRLDGRPARRATSARRSGGSPPYRAGRISSVIPGVEDDLAPAAIADVEDPPDEPARPGDDEPPGLDREAARAGDRPGSPRAGPAARGRTAPGRGPARRTAGPGTRRRRRACRDPAGRRGAGRAPRARGGRRRARRRPRRAAIRRGDGSRAAGRRRRSPRARSTAAVSSVSVIPNFEPPAPDGQRRLGLGVRRRGSAGTRTSIGGRPARPRPARQGPDRERVGLVGRLERDPQQGVPGDDGPDRRVEVGVGLADALEADPGVRDAGRAGRRPLAARDDVRAEAASRPPWRAAITARDVVGLDRVLPDPRVGERGAELRGGRRDRRLVGQVERRPVAARPPARRRLERSSGSRSRSGAGRPLPADAAPPTDQLPRREGDARRPSRRR